MKVFQTAIWDFSSRIANYLVSFVVSIILTRLLNPEEFGAFGIILAISVFAWVLLDFGFRASVVQTFNISQTQLSTIFVINLLIATAIALFLLLLGGPLERFYAIADLHRYIAGISPVFILNGLMVVPSGLLQRDLKLKGLSIFSVISACITGAITILMAMWGYGVWSLIASNVLNALFTVAACFFLSKWRPSLVFDLASVRSIFDFGWRILAASLLDVSFARADVFIIGKLFDTTTLGFYTRAQSLDQQVRMFSVSTIVTIMLATFSKYQHDLDRLRDIFRRALHFVAFTTIAAAGLLSAMSRDLFVVLFTEKWLPSAGFFAIIAITSATYPISYVMMNLITGRGNSRALLTLEAFRKAFLLPVYFSFFLGGIFTFLIAMSVVYTLSLLIIMRAVQKEIGVSLFEQVKTIGTYALTTLASALLASETAQFVSHTPMVRVIVLSGIFGIVYLFLNWIFNTTGFGEFSARISDVVSGITSRPMTGGIE